MENQNSKSNRTKLRYKQHLNASPEEVFPLLCPKREYEWIEHWKCDIIYSESGYAEQDCVFTTDFPGEPKQTWVVDQYEPNRLIQFIRACESWVVRYRITLSENEDGTTSAIWEQIIIALDEVGNQYIKTQTQSAYDTEMQTLERLLNHYLETGKMLMFNEL
ncbi:MAG: SRPBCC family protein [Bacteroidota bacterium]